MARSPEAAIEDALKVPSPEIPGRRASLATLYTALMMSEALDAVESRSPIVIDGPFSRNDLLCSLLAALRPRQHVASSLLQEGTAAGAAVLALMNRAGDLPERQVELRPHEPGGFARPRRLSVHMASKGALRRDDRRRPVGSVRSRGSINVEFDGVCAQRSGNGTLT